MRKQRNIVRNATGLIFTLLALAGPSFSQASNGWTAIGPSGSGYVNSVAIDPGNPNVIYVGTYYGVFKTTDGGASWKNSSLPPTHAIAVDPVNPNVVYAGTHPGGTCQGTYPLFKSIDAGATWSNATSPPDCDISVIVLDPHAPSTIYAVATVLWAVNGDPVGTWKSTDGGMSWSRQGALGPGVWISPSNPQIIYAGNGDYYDTSGINLFKSTDGGISWSPTGPIASNPDDSVFALALDPINPNVLYAVTYDFDNGSASMLQKSIDGGTSWLVLGTGLGARSLNSIVIDRNHPQTLYVGTSDGVFKSTNGGVGWDSLNDGLYNRDVVSLVLAAGNARVLYAGTAGGGLFKLLDSSPSSTNEIDDAQFFVHQHYRDFLNREPDADGLAFWTNEIVSCGGDTQCIEAKRINVSAAYFLSIEFQQTGYLVYRTYKASYGNLPNAPVPIKFNEFLPDTQQVGQGVIVNQTGWEQLLENNKQNFFSDFVQRSRFTSAYPTSLTPDQFVDQLFVNAGVTPAASDRAAAINEFGSSPTAGDTAARARALRSVAENSTLAQQEFNRAFVLMQYFGYLRRNPNDAPEAGLNFDGYNFWLNKLNQFNGDYIAAEMVKAFIVSSEYKHRFGP